MINTIEFIVHIYATVKHTAPPLKAYKRPKHLDNVSMSKCSQQRLRKGHFDRKDLENDRNVRRHFY